MTAIALKSQLRMSLLRYALVTVPFILLLGIISARISSSGYGNPWFDALAKPSIMPPSWAFPAAWTLLYVLLGLSLAFILHARGARGRGVALSFFAAQMVLNFAWSPVFFAMHRVQMALVIIIAMFVLAFVTAYLFSKIRRSAGLLMIPYLAWLCFAGLLNYQIMELNPGAESLVPTEGSADIAL